MKDGETKRMLRHVQMYIDEYPGNRLLNKSKTILIWILSVTLVKCSFTFISVIKINIIIIWLSYADCKPSAISVTNVHISRVELIDIYIAYTMVHISRSNVSKPLFFFFFF